MRQPVGWTLVFEMRFYLLVAIVVLLFRNRAAGFATLAIGLIAAAQIWPTADVASSPIMLEFVMGMAVAAICQSKLKLPLPALFLVALCWLLYASFEIYPATEVNAFRWYGFGPPAAIFLYLALMLEQNGKLAVPGVIVAAGNASYSTYLWHLGLIGVLTVLWPRGPVASVAYLVAVLALTALVSAVSYQLVERPLLAAARGRSAESRRRRAVTSNC
jgi:exopolysaccharide production protein ExoZ